MWRWTLLRNLLMIIENYNYYVGQSRFRYFSKMLGGTDYFPFIRAYGFTYSQEPTIAIEHLRKILSDKKLSGFIKACSLVEIKQVINNAASWNITPQGVFSKTNNKELIEARTFIFLDTIEAEFFYDKIEYYFIYQPAPDDYFADTILWSFCFIVLSKEKGIIFCGKTWSNAIDCKPETDEEAFWRKNCHML